MHILVTNDDGPPSPESSPYIHALVAHLESAGHAVSVILPHTQRSWIGKAHMIGQTVRPTYYKPGPNIHGKPTGTISEFPSKEGNEWILVDGTPASCVQIGGFHFFEDRGPIDLVLSGPNYGRNTTAVFALSSGTMGAALEAAVCGFKAIAVSYAFFDKNHDQNIIEAATRHTVRVVEAVYKQWPEDRKVDLYSINVPLVAGVEEARTVWTDMLQNYWRDGSCFDVVEVDSPAVEAEKKDDLGHIVHRHKHFAWAPKFKGVYQSVDESTPGNDGWAVQNGMTSVTPLKANFFQAAHELHGKDVELPPIVPKTEVIVPKETEDPGFFAVVNYNDGYVHPLIIKALNELFPGKFTLLHPEVPTDDSALELSSLISKPDAKILQIMPYEALDFEYAGTRGSSVLINSYMIRKALIRKHYLALAVRHWVAKKPDSILAKAVTPSDAFEVDYAEFLDDALVEAFDLRESMEKNEGLDVSERDWWILKPGMSDRGQGIRLFSSMEELQGIFDEWEEDMPGTDDEDEEGDGVMASHLRHFVAQRYVHPPLLPLNDDRKFHIRTYVTCIGRMKVHVYEDMLALSASTPYDSPWATEDLNIHLTNTCRQSDLPATARPVVTLLDNLSFPASSGATPSSIKEQIYEITGDVFEGAARAMGMHFSPLENAFEVFGVDFLVGADGTVVLLEVNAFPDFGQTGGELEGVVEGVWRETLRRAVSGAFGVEAGGKESGKLREVRVVDMGL